MFFGLEGGRGQKEGLTRWAENEELPFVLQIIIVYRLNERWGSQSLEQICKKASHSSSKA
jgi:hypothetical protein